MLEQRVEALELELANVAQIIDLEGRLNKTRFEAVFADLDIIKRRIDQLGSRVEDLGGRFEELPSAVARKVAELLAKRDKAD